MCAVIGWPVAHSLSPAMHNAAYSHLALDYAYAAFPVPTGEVAAAIAGAQALGFAGLNVTVPHKEAALACCVPDAVAKAVGAVNTITFDGGAAAGTNTDVYGLEQTLSALAPAKLARAVILGSGGAARAAAYVLAARGIAFSVCARRERRIHVGDRHLEVFSIDALGSRFFEELLAEADLLVDATPLGLGDEPTPWPVAALRSDAVVVDLVVRKQTPLSRAATARGLRVQVGDVMLLHQGAAAFTRFTGVAAPVEVMGTALHSAMEAE